MIDKNFQEINDLYQKSLITKDKEINVLKKKSFKAVSNSLRMEPFIFFQRFFAICQKDY